MDSRGITLTLTESCNLKCSYCYEHNKSNRVMSFETAKSIIDYELGQEGQELVTIDLFGGEPFLEFELIKKICDYVWSKDWKDKQYHFFVSTNGTLISDNVKEWLVAHREDFWCGLSYDGTPEMNDINRSKSSSMIDLNFFAENWPTQGVKMTVSNDSIKSLAEGVIYLHNKGFEVNCNLAYGLNWGNKELRDTYEGQLLKLIDFYLDNPTVKPCSMLNMELKYVGQADLLQYEKWCGAGTKMRVYAVDGECYPCHYFEPLSIGEEKAKLSLAIDFSDTKALMDSACKKCCLRPICPTCYGNNFASTGDVSKKDINLCELTKIQAKANSYLWFKKLNQFTLEELNISIEDKKLITDAIIKIQNEL